MRIIVATHNEGKLVEINRILEDCLGADADQVELVSAGSICADVSFSPASTARAG